MMGVRTAAAVLALILLANCARETAGIAIENVFAVEFFGLESGSQFGATVSAAGDLNGDGFADFAIAAPKSNANAGSVFLEFGRSTEAWAGDPQAKVAIVGSVSGMLLGQNGIAHGDFNGDGLSDLVIGTSSSGRAYVVYGSDSGPWTSFNVSFIQTGEVQGFTIQVELGGTQMYVGNAGDMNGDGIEDILVSSTSGTAYVVFGEAGANRSNFFISSINGANGFSLTDGTTTLGIGIMDSVGDMNGDGVADLAIGSYQAGCAYIVYARNVSASGVPWPSSFDLSSDLNGTNGFIIEGNSSEAFGKTVVGAGDVNGDGFADIFIGPNNGFAGAWVVFGRAAPWPSPFKIGQLNGNNGFHFASSGSNEYWGSSGGAAGDVDGDGLEDIIIGGFNAPNSTGTKTGAVVVLFGHSGQWPAELTQEDVLRVVGYSIEGPGDESRFGSSARSAGDVDGNGLADFIVGAYTNEPGYAAVFFGGENSFPRVSSTESEEQQTPSSSATPPGGGGGHALAIALGVSIPLLALIAGAIVLAVCIASRRRGRDGTSSSKRESAAGAVEMGSASGKAVAVACTPETLDFTHNGKDLCRVGEVATFPFAVTNPSGKRFTIEFKPEASHKWEIAFDPPTLTLNPHEENAPATCQLKLLCTTVMSGIGVPMVVQGNEIGQLWVSAEGALSSMLDRDEIVLERALGSGSFATVHVGKWRGTSVAVKVFREHLFDITELAADVRREVDLCMNLRHPNIIQYFGAAISKSNAVIVMELATNGSLGDAIKEHKLAVAAKFRMAHDVASGMLFLHTSHVIHRDLKPDNVLLMSLDPNAPVCGKLSDFGTSRVIGSTDAARTYTKGVGTPVFCAPEVLDGHRYSSAADVYSFSMLLWNLFSEITPFSEVESIFAMVKMIGEGKRPGMLDVIPEEIRPMIEGTWQTSADERAKFDTIVPELERIMAANGTLPAHMAPHRL